MGEWSGEEPCGADQKRADADVARKDEHTERQNAISRKVTLDHGSGDSSQRVVRRQSIRIEPIRPSIASGRTGYSWSGCKRRLEPEKSSAA